jgi:DNA-binding response OmpR family regulator
MMTTSQITPEGRSPGARILVVDDERTLRRTLARQFEHLGYQVTQASSGPEALEHIKRKNFDLVLLDLKMPGMDGSEVLEEARPLAPDTVFIVLTAYGTLNSAIVAIRQGAFDYLLKPSPMEEIVRAVEAGLARRQRQQRDRDPVTLLEQALVTLKTAAQQPETLPAPGRFLQAADVTVDVLRRLAVVRGQPVDLSPTEFVILAYLLRHQDRVVTQRELVAHLHGCDLDERDARLFLHSHIHRLRRKVERDPAQPHLIRTVRGSGYIISLRAARAENSPTA